MRTARKPRYAPKQKKSYTLSRSSVAFLKRLHREKSAPSVSAVLDGLIREAEEQRKREAIEAQITAYYDNMTEQEAEEMRDWGEVAMQQLRRAKS
jgi:hypothetical protein